MQEENSERSRLIPPEKGDREKRTPERQRGKSRPFAKTAKGRAPLLGELLRLLVPLPRTLGAQLHDRINYPWLAFVWITKPPRSPRSFSRPRAFRELRRLCRIIREKYFGLALPHTPDARTQIFKPSIERMIVG
jgi:hypothetical protein